MKELRTRFQIPIYDYTITLVVTEDMEKWDKKYPNDMASNACEPDAMCVPDNDSQNVFIVLSPRTALHNITHEIGHAARHVMNAIGFHIKSDNDEPLAYLEGYLAKRIHAKLKILKCLDKKKRG